MNSPNPHEITAFATELRTDAPQVDLHGMRVDEALQTLEQEIHHCFMEGIDALQIIHGRGDGKLRNAIHTFLKQQTELVALFRDSQMPGREGGVTIVVLHTKTSR